MIGDSRYADPFYHDGVGDYNSGKAEGMFGEVAGMYNSVIKLVGLDCFVSLVVDHADDVGLCRRLHDLFSDLATMRKGGSEDVVRMFGLSVEVATVGDRVAIFCETCDDNVATRPLSERIDNIRPLDRKLG